MDVHRQLCVCACVSMLRHASTHMCASVKARGQCQLSSSIGLHFIWDSLPLTLELTISVRLPGQQSPVLLLSSSRFPPVSAFPRVLGTKLQASWLHSRHFTLEPAPSPCDHIKAGELLKPSICILSLLFVWFGFFLICAYVCVLYFRSHMLWVFWVLFWRQGLSLV